MNGSTGVGVNRAIGKVGKHHVVKRALCRARRNVRSARHMCLCLNQFLPPPIRIIALRCDTCAVKLPYTDEHFDVARQARTCRHCAGAQVVTIVNPLDNTARRSRLIISDEAVSCGEGAEAYAAFARAERAAGHHVVIQW